ncbi:hypothetical protein LTR97_004972 [Elasticomyces elasticus]|uniref:Uncharacterized protein n=1 Tax=Elasticomyces elasticus TaxID=574655 RepID=A0AAN8A2J1_9PEZI|nr:hypothetical protein LTR97_004972 [Elasticomyces elasticus]
MSSLNYGYDPNAIHQTGGMFNGSGKLVEEPYDFGYDPLLLDDFQPASIPHNEAFDGLNLSKNAQLTSHHAYNQPAPQQMQEPYVVASTPYNNRMFHVAHSGQVQPLASSPAAFKYRITYKPMPAQMSYGDNSMLSGNGLLGQQMVGHSTFGKFTIPHEAPQFPAEIPNPTDYAQDEAGSQYGQMQLSNGFDFFDKSVEISDQIDTQQESYNPYERTSDVSVLQQHQPIDSRDASSFSSFDGAAGNTTDWWFPLVDWDQYDNGTTQQYWQQQFDQQEYTHQQHEQQIVSYGTGPLSTEPNTDQQSYYLPGDGDGVTGGNEAGADTEDGSVGGAGAIQPRSKTSDSRFVTNTFNERPNNSLREIIMIEDESPEGIIEEKPTESKTRGKDRLAAFPRRKRASLSESHRDVPAGKILTAPARRSPQKGKSILRDEGSCRELGPGKAIQNNIRLPKTFITAVEIATIFPRHQWPKLHKRLRDSGWTEEQIAAANLFAHGKATHELVAKRAVTLRHQIKHTRGIPIATDHDVSLFTPTSNRRPLQTELLSTIADRISYLPPVQYGDFVTMALRYAQEHRDEELTMDDVLKLAAREHWTLPFNPSQPPAEADSKAREHMVAVMTAAKVLPLPTKRKARKANK